MKLVFRYPRLQFQLCSLELFQAGEGSTSGVTNSKNSNKSAPHVQYHLSGRNYFRIIWPIWAGKKRAKTFYFRIQLFSMFSQTRQA